ncbi:hypothetical protein M0812_11137 [Anaeramoeba flamelloides]|uniref:Uncharacterized protein n=1 Tax=Anaeramoeba flamelloides TaxID=1746091 RepID=A0AAV7ZXC6_9EUKA|nr:hypothetical protein M0812_11137 [Anaeramoeba flamelloides]
MYIRPSPNLRKRFGPDSWCLITGASDGIGKEFSFRFASLGFNIILVSRTLSKLEKVENEIKEKYPNIKTKVIAQDLSDYSSKMTDKIEEETKDLRVDVLINNVGACSRKLTLYIDTKLREDKLMMNVNMMTLVVLSKLYLKKMLKRKNGIVINLSSGSGKSGTPYLATYSSTKAFCMLFSNNLNLEYKEHGITVQAVTPFYVSTRMSNMKPSFFVPSTKSFMNATMKQFGSERNIWPNLSHKLIKFFGTMHISYAVERSLLTSKGLLKNADERRQKRAKKLQQEHWRLERGLSDIFQID